MTSFNIICHLVFILKLCNLIHQSFTWILYHFISRYKTKSLHSQQGDSTFYAKNGQKALHTISLVHLRVCDANTKMMPISLSCQTSRLWYQDGAPYYFILLPRLVVPRRRSVLFHIVIPSCGSKTALYATSYCYPVLWCQDGTLCYFILLPRLVVPRRHSMLFHIVTPSCGAKTALYTISYCYPVLWCQDGTLCYFILLARLVVPRRRSVLFHIVFPVLWCQDGTLCYFILLPRLVVPRRHSMLFHIVSPSCGAKTALYGISYCYPVLV